jgi:GTP-binding protein
MFISKIKIFVRAGNGGQGAVSFRREKYVPYGGPDGGDGGDGGNIIIQSDKSINTLAFFKYHRHFFAKNGQPGMGSNMKGKSGENCIIKVPVGTAIYDKDNNFIMETTEDKEEYVLEKGGHAGIGNSKMATSTDRAPRTRIPPEICEMKEINLLLTLKTDVGILGAPNAGKSSLINALSRANSIVGDYAFTTLNPVLGQMYETNISLMDLPGIIEGAYKGKGRGLEFLRHSEQCKIFIHLIDISQNPEKDYQMILGELEKYGNSLINKSSILVFNKIDEISLSDLEIYKNLYNNALFISIKENIELETLKEKILSYFPQEIITNEDNIFETEKNEE